MQGDASDIPTARAERSPHRVAGLTLVCVALVSAVCVFSGNSVPVSTSSLIHQNEAESLAQVTDACPPPCVPSVFSQEEAAELTGGMNKGKSMVPAGDEAVEEAMRAANDASNHFQISGGTSDTNPVSLADPAPEVLSNLYHPVSQWAKMHPVSSKLQAQQINSQMHAQNQHFLELGGGVGPTQRRKEKSKQIAQVEAELRTLLAGSSTSGTNVDQRHTEMRSQHPLREALDRMSKRRLRGVVRGLLRGEGQYLSDGGYTEHGFNQLAGSWGDRRGYESLRDRFRAEDEALELRHLREAEQLSDRRSERTRHSSGGEWGAESLWGQSEKESTGQTSLQDDRSQSKAKQLLALLEGNTKQKSRTALKVKPSSGKARVQLLASIPKNMEGQSTAAKDSAVESKVGHVLLDASTQTVLKALKRIAAGKK